MQEAGSGGRTGLDIHLHPLVILNISDHWTRAQVYSKSGGSTPSRTIGAIMGFQVGKIVAVHESFPIPYLSSGAPDWEYLVQKFKMQKEVHETYEILGWYSAGDFNLKADTAIHRELIQCELNEDFSPLYLTINVHDEQSDKLPIKVFESELVQNPDTEALDLTFNQIPYVIETEESERVAVDEIARANKTVSTAAGSALASHLSGLCESLENVENRVAVVTNYLQQARDGLIPYDHSMLRRVSALVASLPSSDDPEFQTAFRNDFNDALLVVLLAAVTKAAASMDAALIKTNVLSRSLMKENKGRRQLLAHGLGGLEGGSGHGLRKMKKGRGGHGGGHARFAGH